MTIQATGLPIHSRAGAFASLRRGVREAFAYAGGVQVENRLIPTLDGVRQLAADGTIGELGVGLSLSNSSAQTLEYELTAMHMSIEGRQGAASALSTLRGEIAPGRCVLLAEFMAAVAPLSPGGTLQGSFDFAIRYGLPGAARHRLTACYAIAFKSASPGEIAAFTWYPI